MFILVGIHSSLTHPISRAVVVLLLTCIAEERQSGICGNDSFGEENARSRSYGEGYGGNREIWSDAGCEKIENENKSVMTEVTQMRALKAMICSWKMCACGRMKGREDRKGGRLKR